MKFLLPHVIIIILISLFFSKDGFNHSKDYDLSAFARLPVMQDGRKKPMDTLSRNLLMVLSAKTSIETESGDILDNNQWFLEMISGREDAMHHRFIRITNKDILASLNLEPRKGNYKYSYLELLPGLPVIEQAVQVASKKDKRDYDLYDREIIKLANRITLFQMIVTSFEDPRLLSAQELLPNVQRYMRFENESIPLVVPPTEKVSRWRPLMSSLVAAHPAMKDIIVENDLIVSPLALRWASIIIAYAVEDIDGFNNALTGYQRALQRDAPHVLSNLSFEVYFNQLNPFVKLSWIYVFIFIGSCLGWLFRKKSMLKWVSIAMLYTAILHTLSLVARVFLSGYPPVTNLYSSAIFVGWGAVILGLILEKFSARNEAGAGLAISSVVGALTLLVAHFLSGNGDTLHQLQAVLDTRFWLSTHVVTITLGYMAVFIAGIAGIFYILLGVFTNRMDASRSKELNRILYGVTCFAILLSFVGTILGGLWADDSWGRFWGWDPKENGALLIVTWCAIMLHARWGRMVATRGFAIMAVFGNIVTAWSWFGVNQLGIGLHSYGFTDAASKWLIIFCLSQLAVCLIGVIPPSYWRSKQI